MARSTFPSSVLPLVTVGLLASACYTFRSAGANRTVWDELPNDPRPELWVEGSPRAAVVFDGVYSAMGDAEPALDERWTAHFLRLLRRAHLFSEVLDRGPEAIEAFCRVRMERIFREDDNTAANFTKAATVPGLLGYRFGMVATLTLELERPGGDQVIYEARSRLTHIYHHSRQRDAARRMVYREADHANTQAILHQLHADPDLFDPVMPVSDPPQVSCPGRP